MCARWITGALITGAMFMTMPAAGQATNGHSRAATIREIHFSPDGKYLLAQTAREIVVLTRQPLAVQFRIAAENAGPAEFTADSKQVAFVREMTALRPPPLTIRVPYRAGDAGASVERWNVADQGHSNSAAIPYNDCEVVKVSPDGRVLACDETNGTLLLLDVDTMQTRFRKVKFGNRRMRGNAGDPGSATMDFSPDGSVFAALPYRAEGLPVAVDARSGEPIGMGIQLRQDTDWHGFALVATDRLLVRSRWFHGEKLLEFPSGKVLAAAVLPPGQFHRAADARYVITRMVPRAGREAKAAAIQAAPIQAAAVEYATGRAVDSKWPALDVYGEESAAEHASGEVGLYRIGKGLEATVRVTEE